MTPAGRTAAIWSITAVVATAVLAAIFDALDPQPGSMTVAVQGFSSAEMNAWLAAVLLAASGAALFARYVASSVVGAATSKAPKWPVVALITVVAALLILGILLGQLAVCGSLTVLPAMVLNEITAATRSGEERPDSVRTHKSHDYRNRSC
ncbi:hypothetical protein [Arthrobacter sp. H14]|uniref:hypothetical protein n=1 Tax=Arthrobacter sp. H14 TaxID=1312959 RepID=UPI00047C9F0F|nr:hypothetical protein [Arthrobacter sp. H14]